MWSAMYSAASRSEFDPVYDQIVGPTRIIEGWIEQQDTISGWCECCGAVAPLTVTSGVFFAEHPSLRAGLICPRGLNSRGRALLVTLKRWGLTHGNCALFEDGSPLANALLRNTSLKLYCSEYFDGGLASGASSQFNGRTVVHQDMTSSSYGDGEFDVVVHSDVLEHIPDYRSAFGELHRILKPGGTMMFTVPFFIQQDTSVPLAEIASDGSTRFLTEPPEYHGDPVRGAVLTYWHFGWDMLQSLRNVGFSEAELIMSYDPFAGIVSDNHPMIRDGNNPPLVMRARK